MFSIAFFIVLLPTVVAHSWMTCPPSFVPLMGRGGIQDKKAQCELEGGSSAITEVEAGDRLKIGWTSNNHGGGLARISLVPYGQHKGSSNAINFNQNVMKFACYGHDERAGKFKYGDCKHPCNGRGGCEYQSDKSDVERYDTTIGIPTNLNGDYVLQTAMIVGNGGGAYYSCARLRIKGGNTGFSCSSNKSPVTYNCKKSAGGFSSLTTGTKRGNFCYGLDGSVGTVDDYMTDVPINVECDPRQTCGNSIDRGLCEREFPGMSRIISPGSNPRQPNCRVYNIRPVFGV